MGSDCYHLAKHLDVGIRLRNVLCRGRGFASRRRNGRYRLDYTNLRHRRLHYVLVQVQKTTQEIRLTARGLTPFCKGGAPAGAGVLKKRFHMGAFFVI